MQLAGSGSASSAIATPPPLNRPTSPAPPRQLVISVLLAPFSLQFGEVRLGFGADRLVTITNSGNAPVLIGQVQITGDHWNDFRIVDGSCNNRILNSGYCHVRVSFIPSEAGQHRALLAVGYNGERSHLTAWISGSASPQIESVFLADRRERGGE